MQEYSRPKAVTAALILTIVLVIGGSRNFVLADNSTTDQLAYYVYNYGSESTMMLFEPSNSTTTPFLPNIDYSKLSSIRFSADGRLAFSATRSGNTEIYVWDTQSSSNAPENISQTSDANEKLLGWSRDGRYLAFESIVGHGTALIYLWDGYQLSNITPIDLGSTVRTLGVSYTASWSFDGRLVFEVFFFNGDISEIYVWNGTDTVRLSQNPTGEDRYPEWSIDGQLAFLSAHNGDYDLFVWDGVSVKDGVPDRDTFTNIASPLTTFYSFPAWTNEGELTFVAQTPQDTHTQVYLWDGSAATNISQNPDLNNADQSWADDGRWVFSTFFGGVVTVRDRENNTILETKGAYPRWSPTGYLTFCRRSEVGWELLLWNGENISSIAQGQEIWGQWRGGTEVYCTSG